MIAIDGCPGCGRIGTGLWGEDGGGEKWTCKLCFYTIRGAPELAKRREHEALGEAERQEQRARQRQQ